MLKEKPAAPNNGRPQREWLVQMATLATYLFKNYKFDDPVKQKSSYN